eukprot:3055171-Pleurochrysis_carterae.AAC.1
MIRHQRQPLCDDVRDIGKREWAGTASSEPSLRRRHRTRARLARRLVPAHASRPRGGFGTTVLVGIGISARIRVEVRLKDGVGIRVRIEVSARIQKLRGKEAAAEKTRILMLVMDGWSWRNWEKSEDAKGDDVDDNYDNDADHHYVYM